MNTLRTRLTSLLIVCLLRWTSGVAAQQIDDGATSKATDESSDVPPAGATAAEEEPLQVYEEFEVHDRADDLVGIASASGYRGAGTALLTTPGRRAYALTSKIRSQP